MIKFKKNNYLEKFGLMLVMLFISGSCFSQNASSGDTYLVGYGKSDISYTEACTAYFGFAEYHKRANSDADIGARIHARVVAIREKNSNKQFVFINADLGAIFDPLRQVLVAKIKSKYPLFEGASLMITATHTHHAPAGMSHYAYYSASVPGFKSDLTEFTAQRMFEAVDHALSSLQPMNISMKQGRFADDVPVAFNRAVKAVNKNPEVKHKFKKIESNLAINRNMDVMSFTNLDGVSRGLMSWFGAHPNEIKAKYGKITGASKGYAADYTEERFSPGDVALFIQSGAGDSHTTDSHNPELFNENMGIILGIPSYTWTGATEEVSKWNGKTQSNKAIDIHRNGNANLAVTGGIKYQMLYFDLSKQVVDSQFSSGESNARTGPATVGTSILNLQNFNYNDGPSLSLGIANSLWVFSKFRDWLSYNSWTEEKKQYRKNRDQTQWPKKVFFDAVEKTSFSYYFTEDHHDLGATALFTLFENLVASSQELRRFNRLEAMQEHSLIPTILPVQLVTIGNVAIAGIPTELTVYATERLKKSLLQKLKPSGVEQVIVSSYANEYGGYTTTYEEYKEQRYEASHTLYGRHQLGAFQTIFNQLADNITSTFENPLQIEPLAMPVFSPEELSKRTDLYPLSSEGCVHSTP